MTLQQVHKSALKLSLSSRKKLIAALAKSIAAEVSRTCPPGVLSDADPNFMEIIKARIYAYEGGETRAIPWERIRAKMEAKINERKTLKRHGREPIKSNNVTTMGTTRLRLMLAVALLFFAFQGLAAARAIPTSVSLVYRPAHSAAFEVGMLQATFSDGHTEFFDKSDKCGRPKISKHGDVGWSVWVDSFPGRYGHSFEILRLRTHDGALKEFKPNAYFIMDWGFDNDDTAIVIESMEHHGPSFYIKYDIASGKILGRVDVYESPADLPAWAKPYDKF